MGSRQRRRYADLSVPRTQWKLHVELPEDGLRLDQFLAKRVKWKSRTELKEFVQQGEVRVNGTVRKASTRLATNDDVVIQIDPPAEAFDPATIPIEVIFDDGRLMCINKQPGLVVHPTGIHQLDNVLSALHARYRRTDDPELDRVPHVCHRLDMHTSGVFLIAFHEQVKAHVSLQFERREPRKQYRALVHGVPAEVEGDIDGAIRFTDHGYPRLEVHPAGLPSLTGYRVEESFGDAALVSFFPRTGRTHQIRVHASSIGHPLLGDVMYGGQELVFDGRLAAEPPTDGASPLLDRYALHAASIQIVHPDTGETTVFEAPLPEDFVRTLDALRAANG